MNKELEVKIEDMWDFICSQIGFDKKGKEIQRAIKKFVELKMFELMQKQIKKLQNDRPKV